MQWSDLVDRLVLNLLFTPGWKFPDGRPAVATAWSPDVKYSVENGRTHGQRAGVIIGKGFSWASI